ncbi:hypothetical protein [Deinococcus sp. UYEF24]
MKKMICAIIALVTLGSFALADSGFSSNGTAPSGTTSPAGTRAYWAG